MQKFNAMQNLTNQLQNLNLDSMPKRNKNKGPDFIRRGKFNLADTSDRNKNTNPAGEREIRVPKKRKFANKPAEQIKLQREVLQNHLAFKGDKEYADLVIQIYDLYITKDNIKEHLRFSGHQLEMLLINL